VTLAPPHWLDDPWGPLPWESSCHRWRWEQWLSGTWKNPGWTVSLLVRTCQTWVHQKHLHSYKLVSQLNLVFPDDCHFTCFTFSENPASVSTLQYGNHLAMKKSPLLSVASTGRKHKNAIVNCWFIPTASLFFTHIRLSHITSGYFRYHCITHSFFRNIGGLSNQLSATTSPRAAIEGLPLCWLVAPGIPLGFAAWFIDLKSYVLGEFLLKPSTWAGPAINNECWTMTSWPLDLSTQYPL